MTDFVWGNIVTWLSNLQVITSKFAKHVSVCFINQKRAKKSRDSKELGINYADSTLTNPYSYS